MKRNYSKAAKLPPHKRKALLKRCDELLKGLDDSFVYVPEELKRIKHGKP